ncbi:MAG: DUF4336 domain-containing protein [Myxococcota bacterium]
MLRELADDLFVTERPLRFAGLEVGTRMTVIRLAGGELLLHSPVRLDAALRTRLEALGAPRFAVAPNRFHHLFVGEVVSSWPEVELYGAPGLERKRPDLAFREVLGDEPPKAWAGQLEQCLVAGFPLINEVVFFHPPTRTLVASDLAFQVGPETPTATRLFLRMAGVRQFGPTYLERLLARDRAAARRSFERILDWDFDRIVVAHGPVLESGGREALRAGYRWLL